MDESKKCTREPTCIWCRRNTVPVAHEAQQLLEAHAVPCIIGSPGETRPNTVTIKSVGLVFNLHLDETRFLAQLLNTDTILTNELIEKMMGHLTPMRRPFCLMTHPIAPGAVHVQLEWISAVTDDRILNEIVDVSRTTLDKIMEKAAKFKRVIGRSRIRARVLANAENMLTGLNNCTVTILPRRGSLRDLVLGNAVYQFGLYHFRASSASGVYWTETGPESWFHLHRWLNAAPIVSFQEVSLNETNSKTCGKIS